MKKVNCRPYWVNTSSNKLIKKQIENSPHYIREDLHQLMRDVSLTTEITDQFVYADLDRNKDTLWSLLVLSGYLKVVDIKKKGGRYQAELIIPNKEVSEFYTITITEWMSLALGHRWFNELLANLTNGNIDKFEQQLNEFILESSSFYDFAKDKSERFMHGLMLGLIAGLKDNYIIKSNREGGHGRYDLALIPHDKNNLGIVMEFKPQEETDSKLEDVAERALKQAMQNVYATELTQQGIKNILVLGVGFSGKKVKIIE